ncbi:hypothetical protein DSL72_000770 [Monilinia vaccinii-corymbosi]|uniref:SGNH hydrolase-type esterase domain-containing protein n=1 Tax=Monilinia vaccinii-corymbosi TaxID=61207 RepID=A0A8A3PAE9_9HELO|nr:hypothetical protein DSL72_000770 [Monilinia vaccinii-corymbosi]
MKTSFNVILSFLAAQVCAIPTLYLTGDSTMALGGGGPRTQGFGEYLKTSFKGIRVVNDAFAGRSARSYYNQGRFAAVAAKVVPGDFVLMEFGHNDGGPLTKNEDGRPSCFGGGSETCISPRTGEIVYTYVHYLLEASKLMTAKGAHVVIASPTPDNPWESGTFAYSPSRFTWYAKSVAEQAGPLASFVDHGTYVANIYKSLGAKVVNSYYPKDHTHTSPEGASTVAAAFMKGLMCGGSPLSAYSKYPMSSIPGKCV